MNDNICQLCMNLLWCTEVLYRRFVLFYFGLFCVLIFVLFFFCIKLCLYLCSGLHGLVVISGVRQERTRTVLKVYFREGNQDRKNRQETHNLPGSFIFPGGCSSPCRRAHTQRECDCGGCERARTNVNFLFLTAQTITRPSNIFVCMCD